MKHIYAGFAALTLLAGCSGMDGGGLNPMSWFDRETEPTTAATEPLALIDPRELLPQVTSVEITNTSNGVVVLARGLPPTQGFWDPTLVPTNNEEPLDGFLQYEFRASGPSEDMEEGTEESREIQAARIITADKLEGVIGIRVIALANLEEIALEQI
ncbi:MAG: hypothetical protein OXD33_07385 [Rhodobacteraceae bacterium]|nr:hypothetical protein [Paracoccaceae bacterium]